MTAPPLPRMLESLRNALSPALRPYLQAGRNGHPMLRSPWVFMIPMLDPELANEIYAQKAPRISAAVARRDWAYAIQEIERPYQVEVVQAWWLNLDLSDAELRSLLADVLPRFEFPQNVQEEVLELLQAAGFVSDADGDEDDESDDQAGAHRGRPEAARADGAEDRDEDVIRRSVLGLADESLMTIYRGASDPRHVGMAWTRDREVACWFARRFGIGEPTLFTGQVAVNNVLAAFDYESTILVDPDFVEDIQREAV